MVRLKVESTRVEWFTWTSWSREAPTQSNMVEYWVWTAMKRRDEANAWLMSQPTPTAQIFRLLMLSAQSLTACPFIILLRLFWGQIYRGKKSPNFTFRMSLDLQSKSAMQNGRCSISAKREHSRHLIFCHLQYCEKFSFKSVQITRLSNSTVRMSVKSWFTLEV